MPLADCSRASSGKPPGRIEQLTHNLGIHWPSPVDSLESFPLRAWSLEYSKNNDDAVL